MALALNLATGNGLWLAYCLLGLAVFLFVVSLVRTQRIRPPTRAVWMVGIAWSLHYVGGSLSGLHQIGGPNGLYYAFPWWDNVVHALGSAAVAVAAAAVFLQLGRGLAAFLAVAVATLAGVLVELYEFAQFVWFGTVDQGFYTNTLVDLYSNLIGAALGAILYVRGHARVSSGPADHRL